ncbi:MAG: MFS transporter [Tannerella sp.]|nr:MFS transporter [Tannerella sp.]
MKNKELIPRLWTGSFLAACTGNFLLFFAFYLLLPVMPLYLIEVFKTSNSAAGIVLSCYTVAALIIRPFAGFALDRFPRKPIYLLAYISFILVFVGYAQATLLSIIIFMRVLHGLTFGLLTTASNTIIVDIMPSARRGEGLGYFGVANNLAMAFGPMVSLFLAEKYSYIFIFYFAIGMGLIGFCFANMIRMPQKLQDSQVVKQDSPVLKEEAIIGNYNFLDRFFLLKGLRAGLCLMLLAIPYGMTTSYISIYGKDLGIQTGMGVFFSLMAVGLIGSRLFSGKLVDKGFLTHVISWGSLICSVSFFMLSGLRQSGQISSILPVIGFYIVPFLLGVGYGMMFPAYNTLFVNLAPHNRRATASSTYLTSWDVGIGIGLISGGQIADSAGGLSLAYLAGAVAATASFLIFSKIAAPHFLQNKLR